MGVLMPSRMPPLYGVSPAPLDQCEPASAACWAPSSVAGRQPPSLFQG